MCSAAQTAVFTCCCRGWWVVGSWGVLNEVNVGLQGVTGGGEVNRCSTGLCDNGSLIQEIRTSWAVLTGVMDSSVVLLNVRGPYTPRNDVS